MNNETNYRIEEFKRTDSSAWAINNVFSVKQTDTNTEKVENDLRFIKLVFPPKVDKTWNGHIYLDVVDQPLLDYLKRLNERYEAWISTYDKGKLIVIDVDGNNFHEDANDLGKIINSIDAEINGLF